MKRFERIQRALWNPAPAVCAMTATLLALSACTGEPDAPATVGPTAGADLSTENATDEPTAYTPTLPPYTSDVELSAEGEEDVEELLLLIDSFNYYTAGYSKAHQDGLQSIKSHLSDEVYRGNLEAMDKDESDGRRPIGEIKVLNTRVLRMEPSGIAVVATCFDFSDFKVVGPSGEPLTSYQADSYIALETEAFRHNDGWTITDRNGSSIDCGDF